jgi:hypothetical protein
MQLASFPLCLCTIVSALLWGSIVSQATPPAANTAPTLPPAMNVWYRYVRIGDGVYCVFHYNAAADFAFPRDVFRIALDGLACINTNDLDDPHFWHRNRKQTVYRYQKDVPQSGPVSAEINVAKQYGIISVHNYATFMNDDVHLPLYLRMGDAETTVCPFFCNAGSPWRAHKCNDGYLEQFLFVKNMVLLERAAADNAVLQGYAFTTNAPTAAAIDATLTLTLNGTTSTFTVPLTSRAKGRYAGSSSSIRRFVFDSRNGSWRARLRAPLLVTTSSDKSVPAAVRLQFSGAVIFDHTTAYRARSPRKRLLVY